MRTSQRFLLATLAIFIGVSTFGVQENVSAQEPGAGRVLEEVIVTARRRSENLQQVPVSIEAVLGEEMEMRGMERIEDVIAQTPNVFTTEFGPAGSSNFSMRGIPNVGFFVDGIWQQSSSLLDERSTVELERVEMLRGPQGTLFGRDTTGGAIRVYTRRPAEEFGMRVSATRGSYDRLDLTANADIPLTDTFFTKWTVSRQQRDGFQQSLTVDQAYGEIDNEILRGDLYWTPTNRLRLRLILEDALQQTTHTSGSVLLMDPDPPGPSPAFGFTVMPRQHYELLGFQFDDQSHATGWPGGEVGEHETKANWDGGHGMIVMHEAWTLNVEYDITDALSFTSLTGWREQRRSTYNDFDSSEFQMMSQNNASRNGSVTQEFQFNGGAGRINWVAGVFVWETDDQSRALRWGQTDIDPDPFDGVPSPLALQVLAAPECQVVPPGFLPCRVPSIPNTDGFAGGSEEGWAVFGEVTIDLTDTLSLTLGARQHDQENSSWDEAFATQTPRRADFAEPTRLHPGGALFESAGQSDHQSVSFDADTYRFALTNQFNDDLMAYIGYSEGFNSGGVGRQEVEDQNGNQVVLVFPFDPERIENWEIGVRSDWLDGRLRFNATYFQTDWVDMIQRLQIRNPFTGELIPSGINANVAESEATGAEVTVTGQFTDRFTFDVGLGILDTGYKSIQDDVTGVTLDDKFGMAPELQYSLGGQWDLPIANGGEIGVRVDYNWTDDYIRSYNPDTQIQFNNPGRVYDQEAFGLLNARLTYRAPDRQWEVAVFGTNLTDEFYLQGGFNPAILGMDYSHIARPREAGVSLRLFFN